MSYHFLISVIQVVFIVGLRALDARRCFDSLMILVCWLLWKEKNNRTFNRRVQTIQDVLVRIANETVVWYQADFRRLEVIGGVLGRLSGLTDVTM